jgi:hypothetical protein
MAHTPPDPDGGTAEGGGHPKRAYHAPRLEEIGPMGEVTGTSSTYSYSPDGGGVEAPYATS